MRRVFASMVVVLTGGWSSSACVQRVVQDCSLEGCPIPIWVQSGTPPGGSYPGVAVGVVEVDGERRRFECTETTCNVVCESQDCAATEVEVLVTYGAAGLLMTDVRIGRREDGEHACWLPEDFRVELEVGAAVFQPVGFSLPSDDRDACELPDGPIATIIPWREI